MKIKTICDKCERVYWIDGQVNNYLEEGYEVAGFGCRDGYLYYFLQKDDSKKERLQAEIDQLKRQMEFENAIGKAIKSNTPPEYESLFSEGLGGSTVKGSF